ncbi:MAG: preprotein translocase subunit SecG [Pseudomonadota bacterium]
MENIVLVIHLLLALLLIGAVLLQRSEGGALGIGGGGGNVMSGRSTATALQKATWGLCAAFIATSMVLTWFAIDQAQDRGLGLGGERPAASSPAAPGGLSDLPDLSGRPIAPATEGGAAPSDAGADAPESDSPATTPVDDLPSLPDLPPLGQ